MGEVGIGPDASRQTQLSIHRRPYPHIQPPDAGQLCTCLTCMLTWNNLGLVLDFARWQSNLDDGVPISTLPRGHTAPWKRELVARNARIAQRAVDDALWHARILEMHLDSTVRSIRRHARNKGNRRTHVDDSMGIVDLPQILLQSAFQLRNPPSLRLGPHIGLS